MQSDLETTINSFSSSIYFKAKEQGERLYPKDSYDIIVRGKEIIYQYPKESFFACKNYK